MPGRQAGHRKQIDDAANANWDKLIDGYVRGLNETKVKFA